MEFLVPGAHGAYGKPNSEGDDNIVVSDRGQISSKNKKKERREGGVKTPGVPLPQKKAGRPKAKVIIDKSQPSIMSMFKKINKN